MISAAPPICRLGLLFAMMIISAHSPNRALSISAPTAITKAGGGVATLLALTVAIGGGLSAVLATDILIIAISPLLDRGSARAEALILARW